MHSLYNDSFAPWNQVLILLVIFNTSQDLYKTTVSWRACFTKTNSASTDSLLTCFAVFTILWAWLFTYRQYTAYILSSQSNLVFLNKCLCEENFKFHVQGS